MRQLRIIRVDGMGSYVVEDKQGLWALVCPNSSGVFSHQVLLERLGLELERFALTSNSGRTTDPVDSFRLSVQYIKNPCSTLG